MRGGYESLVWINDEKGREFVCYGDDIHGQQKKFEELDDQQKKNCENVNNLVGTERW